MADRPEVTVVVPTLDRPHLLRRALDSVRGQTLDPARIQVVVVDDGGGDPISVAEVVDEFADLRIGVMHAPVSLGRSTARNLGAARAGADTLLFLDDDDLLHPDHLQRLLEARDGRDDVIAWTGSERVLEDIGGLELERAVHDDGGGELDPQVLRAHNVLPIHAALVPTSAFRAVDGFAPDLQVLEDWDLWLRLLAHASFQRVPGVSCEFRHRDMADDNSVTRERAQHALAIEVVYARHPVPEGPDADALRDRRARIIAGSTAGIEQAFRYDRSVLVRLDPTHDPAGILTQLGAVAERQEQLGGTWEAVIAAPRSDAALLALAGVTGDLVLVWHPIESNPDLERQLDAALRRRATGRTIVVEEDTT